MEPSTTGRGDAPTAASPAISTAALTRSFGDLTAVDSLDLEVERGTFFGFLGPNGAGKSTTIKMLTGVLKPTSGRAALLGWDVDHQEVEAKRRIGVVPEDLALFDRLTGSEQLTFTGRMYGLTRADVRARSGELLEIMGLQDEPSKLIVDYSHGMKKKLSLAAALIHRPEILFLDEPFEGIDAISSRMIKNLLDDLVRSGVTIFLTSHILEIVEKLCSDIAIIHEGRLVARGSLEGLRKGLAVSGDGEQSQAGRSLEEIFLDLLGGEEEKRTLSWLG